jgi:hypothetical protein
MTRQPRRVRRVDEIMESEDRDIAEAVGSPAPERRRKLTLPIWPLLVLVGLAAIAAGVILPMMS